MENVMKVGIIGAGWIAEKHARTMQEMTTCRGYAIAARDLSRAEAFRDKWGFEVAYGSYEALVSDPSVDLVYIATPHSHHYEHARLAIEHGKPCLVEKAFTANARQARELIALAEERGVFITEAIWTRYQPMRAIISDILNRGLIGRPTFVSASLCYPMAHKERIVRPELCGGVMLDLGVYPLNFLRMLFPEEPVKLSHMATLNDTGMDLHDQFTYLYANGMMASMQTGGLEMGDNRAVIRGEKGWIEVENVNNPQHVWVYDALRQLVEEHPCPKQITGYEYQLEACREALLHGWLEHPAMPHAETIRVMELMDRFRHDCGIVYPMD